MRRAAIVAIAGAFALVAILVNYLLGSDDKRFEHEHVAPQADIMCRLQRDILAEHGTYKDLYILLEASDNVSTDDLMIAYLAKTAESTPMGKIRRRCLTKMKEIGLDEMEVLRARYGDPEPAWGVGGWLRQARNLVLESGLTGIPLPLECTSQLFTEQQTKYLLLGRALDVLKRWPGLYKDVFGDTLRKPLKQASWEMDKLCPSTGEGQKK